jgi:hypothetical protein
MNSHNLKPIPEFSNHPSLRGEYQRTIYCLDREFYLADQKELKRIKLHWLIPTNMGEPYRQMAALTYVSSREDPRITVELIDDNGNPIRNQPITLDYSDTINIEMEDAAELLYYCRRFDIPISEDLCRNREFLRVWTAENDRLKRLFGPIRPFT